MPLVNALITPHAPLLLPSIGKEFKNQTRKTRKAMVAAIHDLYASRPDVVVILHPHGPSIARSFAANVSEQLTVSFKEFGDLVTRREFKGELLLSHELKEQAENAGCPFSLLTTPDVSYDAAVPMIEFPATVRLPTFLPILTSNLKPEDHVNFGRLLDEVIHASGQRVAVIASAELSSHTTAAAPNGIRPEGKLFDAAVIKSLSRKSPADHLMAIDSATVEQAEACGYRPILILGGLIQHLNHHMRKLAYDSPFGTGLLVATIQPA